MPMRNSFIPDLDFEARIAMGLRSLQEPLSVSIVQPEGIIEKPRNFRLPTTSCDHPIIDQATEYRRGRKGPKGTERTNGSDRNLAIAARLGMSPFLFGRPHVRSCEFSKESRKSGAECNSRRRLVMAPSSARTQEKLSLLSLLTRGGTQIETGLVQNHSLYCPIRPMSYTGFRVRRKSPVLATPCGRGQRGGTRRGKG